MKGTIFKRAVSTVLSAVMIVSAFAVTSYTASAVDESLVLYESAIRDVTKKYQMAKSVYDQINQYRTSQGLSELTLEDNLTEQAMERAAELSINLSDADLTSTAYRETDTTHICLEADAFLEADDASQIVDYINSNGTNVINWDQALTNSGVNNIGVGVVNVKGNANKLFVCIRTNNLDTGTVASDEKMSQADQTVNTRIRILEDYLNNITGFLVQGESGITTEVALDGTNTVDGSNINLDEKCQISYKLRGEITQNTYAYLVPGAVTRGSAADKWFNYERQSFSTDNMNTFRYTDTKSVYTSITPYSTGTHQLKASIYTASGSSGSSFIRSMNVTVVDPNSTVETKNINDCDISLEYTEVEYDGNAKKPAVTITDGEKTLVEGEDYTISYSNNYSISSTDNPAKVTITGTGNYVGVAERTFMIVYTIPLSLSINTSNNKTFAYIGDTVTVTAKKTGGQGNVTFSFVGTAPDQTAVNGTSEASNDYVNDWKYSFPVDQKGTYTVVATATDSKNTAVTQEIQIQVTDPIKVSLIASASEVQVGTTVTFTAQASGGFGDKTYSFLSSNITINPSDVNGNVATLTFDKDGEKTIDVTVKDAMGTAKTASCKVSVYNALNSVVGTSLTLNGDIGLNFYLSLVSNAYTIIMDGPRGEITVPAEDAFITDSSSAYYKYYKFTYPVRANEMGSDITIKVLDSSNNEITLYKNNSSVGTSYTSTVNKYFDSAKSSSSDEKLLELCDKMSTYGAYAEKCFNENVDLTGRSLADLSAVNAEELKEYAAVRAGDVPDGITIQGYSLVANDKTKFRLYFKADDGVTPTFKVNNQTVESRTMDGKTYVQVANIAADKLDKKFKISITVEDTTHTIECCPLSYAYIVLKTCEDNATMAETYADLSNLVKAMYLYNTAAKNYF